MIIPDDAAVGWIEYGFKAMITGVAGVGTMFLKNLNKRIAELEHDSVRKEDIKTMIEPLQESIRDLKTTTNQINANIISILQQKH